MSLFRSHASSQIVSSFVCHVSVTIIISMSLSMSLYRRGCSLFLSDCTFPVAILTSLVDGGGHIACCGLICIRLLVLDPCCGIAGFLTLSLYFFL